MVSSSCSCGFQNPNGEITPRASVVSEARIANFKRKNNFVFELIE
jgi:hypothetical protein